MRCLSVCVWHMRVYDQSREKKQGFEPCVTFTYLESQSEPLRVKTACMEKRKVGDAITSKLP